MEDSIDDTLTPCAVCLQYMLDMCSNIEVISYINGKLTSHDLNYFLNVPFELKNKR